MALSNSYYCIIMTASKLYSMLLALAYGTTSIVIVVWVSLCCLGLIHLLVATFCGLSYPQVYIEQVEQLFSEVKLLMQLLGQRNVYKLSLFLALYLKFVK